MKLKILLSAYSCEPGFSSERGVGWNWSLQISKYHDVWVLTRLSNKKLIEKEIEKEKYNNLHFIYFDLPKWMRLWKKGEKGLYIYYTLWQFASLFVALKWHRRIKFDLVHYITFGSILLPTFIFAVPTKFIFGPIGGGGNVPVNFWGELSLRGKFKELVRHTVQAIYILNPLLYVGIAKADLVLVRDKETFAMIPKLFRDKTKMFLETGVPPELVEFRKTENKSKEQNKELRIITVGRFIHSKINLITLKTIGQFSKKYHLPFKMMIIGDGSEKAKLISYCKENELNEYIHFTGWLERKEVFQQLSRSDIYLSTSFKEGGSWAIFEAIMMEIPIVCLKKGGQDIILSDDNGLKINVEAPQQVIEDLSDSLLMLANDKELRNRIALKAKEALLESYTWEKLGKKMVDLYSEIEI
ncbi:MAG: glycosyltransferase family 4 protein [Thermodesulfovibrionales bacterium]|nr:glycosyltransferase family 4 protein [Thermodesulfovibrionales bacterium]